jgi:hypothetical protein
MYAISEYYLLDKNGYCQGQSAVAELQLLARGACLYKCMSTEWTAFHVTNRTGPEARVTEVAEPRTLTGKERWTI